VCRSSVESLVRKPETDVFCYNEMFQIIGDTLVCRGRDASAPSFLYQTFPAGADTPCFHIYQAAPPHPPVYLRPVVVSPAETTITVPAGSFHACRKCVGGWGASWIDTLYYAPGVGFVCGRMYHGSERYPEISFKLLGYHLEE
jgi:hypothetical protein